MLKIINAFLLYVIIQVSGYAQSFYNTGGAIINNTTNNCFPITVSGIGNINTTAGLVKICLSATVDRPSDLDISLLAPDGTIIEISTDNGGTSGNDYYNGLCFTDCGPSGSISSAFGPYQGVYIPESMLSAANNNQNADGTWQLCIDDDNATGIGGSLNYWSISFGAISPPALPVGLDCNTPNNITSLPYEQTCSTLAGSVDNYSACSGAMDGAEYIFTYTPLVDECLSIEVASDYSAPSGFPTITLLDACPDVATAANCLQSEQLFNSTENIMNITAFEITAGTTYYISVSSTSGTGGSFDILVTGGSGINGNDNCLNATPISEGQLYCGNNYDTPMPNDLLGPNTSEMTCNGSINNMVYYTFTTDAVGSTVTINLTDIDCDTNCGGSCGIQIALFEEPAGGACQGPGTWGNPIQCETSTTTNQYYSWANLSPNTNYYLIVDGNAGSDCVWNLQVLGDLTTSQNTPCPEITSSELTVASCTIIKTTELFISEYIEGSSNNKCIEVFNGTGMDIDFSTETYQILFYANGGSVPTGAPVTFSGTLLAGDVYVICEANAGAAFINEADQTFVGGYNGNDAITLVHNGTQIDIFGQIGCDPGTQWTDGTNTTLDNVLVRNPSISIGVTTNPAGACGTTSFSTLSTQWTSLGNNVTSNLGSHTFSGASGSSCCDLCKGEQICISVSGSNLPVGGTIDFYASDTQGFDPYVDQSNLLGSLTILSAQGGALTNAPGGSATIYNTPTLTGVMINACGAEGENEFAILNSGNTGIDISTFSLLYNSSNTIRGCPPPALNTVDVFTLANAVTNPTLISNLNTTSGCTIFQAAPTVIPPNSVFIVFSNSLNPANYDFTPYCGSTVYVLFATGWSAAGNFSNSNGSVRDFCLTYSTPLITDIYTYTNTAATIDGTVGNWDAPGNIDSEIPASPDCGVGEVFPDVADPLEFCYTFDNSYCTGSSTYVSGVINPHPDQATPTTDEGTMCEISNTSATTEEFEFCIKCIELTLTQTPVSCIGSSDGTATAIITNPTPDHTYMWSNGETTSSISGLSSGFYTITVSDATACTETSEIQVLGILQLITGIPISSDVSCLGGSDGFAIAFVQGGTVPYNFFWNTNETTSSILNLPANTYTVTVTDFNKCIATANVTINEPPQLIASANVLSNVFCAGQSNGSATITATGGTPTYTYAWDTGASTPTATNLVEGINNFTVTDNNNCTTTGTIFISSPTPLTINTTSDSPLCAGVCNGSATTTPSNGTPPYTYLWSNNQTTSGISNLCDGSYTLTITDNNGCTETDQITINPGTTISASTSINSPVLCFGESSGSATVTTTGGIMPFSYNWDNNETTTTATGLDSGFHNVTVTDTNGCFTTASVEITDILQLNSSAIVNSHVSCFGESDGVAISNTTGGTLPYTFSWSTGSTTANLNDLSAGTHTLVVTDLNGCTSSASVTINQPTLLSAIASPNNIVSCNGSSDGSATITATGGTPAYTYAWDTGASTPTATNLVEGINNFTVTDNNNCTTTGTIFISSPTPLTINTISDSPLCAGVCNGSATTTPSNGTPPYTYLWSNNQTTSGISNLCDGSYTLTITDNNGCTETDQITINPGTTISASTSINSPVLCFGESSGSATVTTTGGIMPFSYNWDNNETTTTATGLNSGFHNVTVTDTNGCFTTASVEITDILQLNSSAIVNSHVSCFGESDGVAISNTTGGTLPYTFSWSTGSTTANLNDLSAGTHTLVVTDLNGCTSSASVTINQPTLLSAIASQNNIVSCNGSSDGSATITATGGTPAYTYAWDTGASTPTATNLVEGINNFTVTDNNNCTTTGTIFISSPTPLTINTISDSPLCAGVCNGSATTTPSNGTPPYTYLWSNNQTTSGISNLCDGSYTLTITDNNGCTETDQITINPGTTISASVSINSPVLCFGESSGSATVTTTGGIMPFSYNWDNNETTTTATGLDSGFHNVTVTDTNGCFTTASVNIGNVSDFAISTTTIDNNISCNGVCDGEATVTVTGGQMPYVYNWEDGQSNPTATGLCVGTYGVTITDANGCIDGNTIIITEPSILNAITAEDTGVSCFGETDGSATVTPTGGTTPYTYGWDNGQLTATVTGLSGGVHEVTVTDMNGCTTTSVITITEPSMLTSSAQQDTGVSCTGLSDGSATITVSGGTSGYNYAWDNGELTATTSNLAAGLHNYTVIDSNGCASTGNVMIIEPNLLSTTTVIDNHVSCNGVCDGQITVVGSGGETPYQYTWSGTSQTTPTITGLCPGQYTVTISDQDGCLAVDMVTITEPVSLSSLGQETMPVSCFGGTDGSATITASGGTPPYTYDWTNGSTTTSATGLPSGIQTITITDNNNCQVTTIVMINQPVNGVGIVIDTQTPSNCTSCDGQASITVTGGTPPYNYLWSNGFTGEDPTDLCQGNNMVTVTDADGCVLVEVTNTGNTSTLVIASQTVNVNTSCATVCDGSASIVASGGQLPYTYQWDVNAGNQATSTATGLCAGIYFVTVIDTDGCVTATNVVATEPMALLTNINTPTSLNCFGDSDGTVTVLPSGGTLPYTYIWNTTATTATLNNLSAGTYEVTVTDNNGCTETDQIAINPGTTISASASINSPVLCFGESSGSATVTTTGGIMPFSYNWDNNETTATATGLDGGFHNVTVTDTNGCFTTASVEITDILQLNSSANVNSHVSCFGESDGVAISNTTGGTLPYTFSWSTGSTTANLNDLSAGTHTLIVTDLNGCTSSASVTINQPTLLSAIASPNNIVSCNGSSDGSATITATGGTPAYTYAWDTGASTPTATNLVEGINNFTVTDNNNCTTTGTIFISSPTPLTINTTSDSPLCAGVCNGSATTTPSNGTPPYTYLWSNNQTTSGISNLCDGSYTLTITDNNGCTETDQITINPGTTISASVSINSPVLCFGESSGSATVTTTGGIMPFSYNWDNNETTTTATGLDGGFHNVTVTDTNGCISTGSVMITEPNLLIVSVVLNGNVSCNGLNDGSAIATATEGISGYDYEWDNGELTAIATDLAAGLHMVTASDMNGCSATASIMITEPVAFTAQILSNTSSSCTACVGTADLSVTGGTGQFVYLWSNGNTVEDPVDLCSATNTVTITDANGCISTASVNIGNVSDFAISTTTIDNNISCTGVCDGEATITVTGGQMPYVYNWEDGQSNPTATGLCVGTYGVTITDANGCIDGNTIIITEPSILNAITAEDTGVSCFGGTDGSATVTPTGGTTPYTYGWDNGQLTATVTGLSGGVHEVTVTDMNGCTTTSVITITEPSMLTSSAQQDIGVSCTGLSDGSATITVSGGTLGYNYAWDNGELTATTSNLAAGLHDYTVIDSNGCTSTGNVMIIEPNLLSTTTVIDNHVSCNGLSNGGATVTPAGGTLPYTYNWSNTETTASATGLGEGMHEIEVIDANGCSATSNVTITEPSVFNVSVNGTLPANCSSCDGSATLTVTGGTPPYQYNWGNGNTTDAPMDLCAGITNVTVTDANGCETTASSNVGNVTTLIINSIVADNHVSCNGVCDGQITVAGSGGETPYQYTWSGTSQTTPTITGLCPGQYTVTISDQDGCLAVDMVTITEPVSLSSLGQEIMPVSCFGGTDGSATITASGGTPPYTYDWTNGSTTTAATGLPSGIQTITIIDNNNCQVATTVMINQPVNGVGIVIDTQTSSNCTSCDGQASITVTGGTPPYNYLWSNGFTGEDPTDLCQGNNMVTVTDADGCVLVEVINTGNTSTLVIASQTVNANTSCATVCDGSASIVASGGQLPYTYQWDVNAGNQATSSATSLCAGIYFVTVIDTDGCIAATNVVVTEPMALLANINTPTSLNCFGDSDGTVTVLPSGGTMPYTYIWNTTATTATLNNLPTGTYEVTVTDNNGCTMTTTTTITEPQLLSASATGNTLDCFGHSDGTIDLTVSGGTLPYTYNWTNGALAVEDPTGLIAGTYNVTVTDNNGCTTTASATITEPTQLNGSATGDALDCFGNSDGMIDLTVSGGTLPYTYSWTNGALAVEDPTGLIAGIYDVTVTDNNGCTTTASATITEPTQLNGSATGNALDCFGDSDGMIDLTVSGGTLPYTYNWTNGALAVEDPTGLIAGIYDVTVTDNNGCTTTASATITEPTQLNGSATGDALDCFGDSDGMVDLTVSGGTLPYTYNWTNGALAVEDPTSLTAGTYNVTVTDNNGCTTTASATITEPTQLNGSATGDALDCFGDSDGMIDLTVSGGTLPYTYSWTNGELAVEDPTGLIAGTYNVTITDNNGCTTTASATITEPTQLNGSATGDALDCFGDSDGMIDLTVSGGTLPYTYSWTNGALAVEDPTGLIAGIYDVTVTDNNGCTTTASATITEPTQLNGSATGNALDCFGNSDGMVDLTVSGGTLPYTYSWTNGALAVEDPTGLIAGIYDVTVTDNNGCTTTASATITEPTQLNGSATTTPASCVGVCDGTAIATANGGTGAYTYQWSASAGGQVTPTAINLCGGNHTVTVTDANGCTVVENIIITQPNILTINVNSLTDVVCFGEANGSAIATPQGGTSPYTYQWDNTEVTDTATGLDAGLHAVTVTDNNNCTVVGTVVINEPAQLTGTITGTNILCNGANDGSATAIAQGGNGNYIYNWSNSDVGQTAGPLTPGNYTVTITDNFGCQVTGNITITEPTTLTTTSATQEVTCFGYNDGRGTLFPAGGTLPYSYSWDNGEVTNPAISLTAGLHTVVITDANGCTYTESLTVGSPTQLTVNVITGAPTCFGQLNGTATATAIGGTAPYTYVWNSTPPQFGQTATGLPAGPVVLDITDANGCQLQNINVTVDDAPQMLNLSTSATDLTCWGGNDGTATVVVSGGTASYSYEWNNGASGQTAFNLVVGTYTVTVTDANGCVDLISQVVGQPDQIAASFVSTDAICFGEENGTITVIDTTISGGMAPYSFSLNGEDYQMGNVFGGLEGGSYTLYVQDVNECVSTYQVLVDEPAELIVDLGAAVVVELGDSTMLDAIVTPSNIGIAHSWTPTEYLSCIDCATPTVIPLETTTYEVIITDTLSGCTVVGQITIEVDKNRNVYIPNAFTPNDDGNNDVFMIYGGTGVSTVRTFNIYDRWGEAIWTAENFQPDNPTFGWDGSFKGKRVNPAVFVYYAEVEFVDGEVIQYKGDVTLLK